MQKIKLWNGIEVPRIGVGCWAIGGTKSNDGPSTSYGSVNDDDSRAGLNRAYEMGARFFDTASGYGAGHSEILIGEEISRHDDAVIVTKFGYPIDDVKNISGAPDVSPQAIRENIEGSRRRLKRDTLDLVFLHLNGYDVAAAVEVFDTLDELVHENKIAAYGWSDDNAKSIEQFIDRPHFGAVENDLNLFTPATDMMKLIAERGSVSICRLPLAMGLLSGKFSGGEKLPNNDVRAQAFDWLRFFKDGQPSPEYLTKLDALKDLLTFGGRTVAQGSLSWILAYSPHALPVPGFKNTKQAEENFAVANMDLLPDHIMSEIAKILGSF
ncbi:MAG: aldo/keto reductase [Hyphomicrobiales bacterium]|nr:MAG: aldo/keto reductase [Hyphomicrobiales bacterium]